MERRKRVIGRLAAGAILLLLSAAAAATAEKPPMVKLGTESFWGTGGFAPKRLPRKEWAPVELALSAEVREGPDPPMPTLKELDLDVDRNLDVDPRGLPICPGPMIQRYPAPNCRPAQIGRGRIEIKLEFPESEPRDVSGRLLAFNGGAKEGKRSIWVHAFLGSPINGELVIRGAVSKERAGRFGTRWTVTIPQIAGGYGRVKDFTMTFNRRFAYKEKRHSYLLAKCPDGRLNGRATGIFADGSSVMDSFVRACVPTG
jgi:hypothetical protein